MLMEKSENIIQSLLKGGNSRVFQRIITGTI
jgi:hypothetical protein